MESAAVAKAAAHADVPFLVIRAVADPAQTALPTSALRALNAEGRLQGFTLLANLFKHPKDILSLWQLAEHFRAASATLQAAVTYVGPTLLAP
jgi:adenosylhomocysteine nucleosidase